MVARAGFFGAVVRGFKVFDLRYLLSFARINAEFRD